MKTKEELTAVKEEALGEKVRKLTDEELNCCSGGTNPGGRLHDDFNGLLGGFVADSGNDGSMVST